MRGKQWFINAKLRVCMSIIKCLTAVKDCSYTGKPPNSEVNNLPYKE